MRLRGVLERRAAEAGALQGSGPFLVLFSGLPGTGKSHFARSLAARVPMMVLESDHLRKSLIAQPAYTPDEHAMVFSAAHLLIEELLQEGWRVLFEATNLTENFRQPGLRDSGTDWVARDYCPGSLPPPGVVRKRLEGANCTPRPTGQFGCGFGLCIARCVHTSNLSPGRT